MRIKFPSLGIFVLSASLIFANQAVVARSSHGTSIPHSSHSTPHPHSTGHAHTHVPKIHIPKVAPVKPKAAPHPDKTKTPKSSSAPKEIKRDKTGRIARSQEAKDNFKQQHPCPANGQSSGACPGYVIDHVKPLACGGADDPSNMQWQTTVEGKAKDKWERKGC